MGESKGSGNPGVYWIREVPPVSTPDMMYQAAPWPTELEDLVNQVKFRGWQFSLQAMDRGQGCSGLTLVITAQVPDSYDPETMIRINHLHIVPAAAYNRVAWRRWLFDKIASIGRHEDMEDFQLVTADGKVERPYAPSHGPGHNPYMIREVGTVADQHTTAAGRVEGDWAVSCGAGNLVDRGPFPSEAFAQGVLHLHNLTCPGAHAVEFVPDPL